MAENYICDYSGKSQLPTVMPLVVMTWRMGAETSGLLTVSSVAQISPLLKD